MQILVWKRKQRGIREIVWIKMVFILTKSVFIRWLPENLSASLCLWGCVCVWGGDADIAWILLQSDQFGRKSRTNRIIVLVWHWVDPSVGQWAHCPGPEWKWLNSKLHPNEYIMLPLSLSTWLWNKEMISTSALTRWWNSSSPFSDTKQN